MKLVDALDHLGIEAELAMGGRWARFKGEWCLVYVVEATRRPGYFTWCDDPAERTVEFHVDPVDAIRAGLDRAARHRTSGTDDGSAHGSRDTSGPDDKR